MKVAKWGKAKKKYYKFNLISCLMQIRASQNLSSSALGSDSVGSIIRAPATGQDLNEINSIK
jgi:hypothetical protein